MPPSADKKAPAHTPDEKQALGALLATARRLAGFSLESAADALTKAGHGITKGGIGHWETGTNVPDALWLRRLARLYRSSADVLVGMEPAAPRWPFSAELHQEVEALDPEDLHFVEVAIWTHLRKDVPTELHYGSAENLSTQALKPRPATLVSLSSNTQDKGRQAR